MATFNNGESLASVRTKINDAIDKIDGNATISNDISVGGNVTVTGTVDGRDVAADGAKLDGIEASADVTDTANVTAAGALMDSELTSEASVKALDQGVATTDSPTFAGLTTTADITFGDNDKAIFGAGSDLEIYSDGTTGQIVGDVNVTGTLTSDGLTVDGQSVLNKNYAFQTANYHIKLGENSGDSYIGSFGNGHFVATGSYYGGNQFQLSGGATNLTGYSAVSDFLIFAEDGLTANSLATPKNRILVSGATGDISFYEDTGTTAKFFWDASAEKARFGGGTSDDFAGSIGLSGQVFTIEGYINNSLVINAKPNASNEGVVLQYNGTDGLILNNAGNVGIGVTDPVGRLEVKNSGDDNGFEFLPAYSSNINLMNSYNRNANTYYPLENRASYFMFKNGTSEAMRIDSSGNVGIGTSSPAEDLDINAANATLRLDAASNSQFGNPTLQFLTNAGNNDYINFGDIDDADVGQIGYVHSADYMLFQTNASEAMRIDSSGNLLVGTTDADPRNFSSGTYGIRLFNSQPEFGVATMYINRSTGTDGNVISFRKDGGTVGSIGVSASSTSYNTSSDHRLKENVVELTGATDRLKQLEPKRFNFIVDADTTVDGFLAHEVQSVVPEAITGTHNEVDADGNPVYQGIDQSKLVPLLVATIKELEARITALENA